VCLTPFISSIVTLQDRTDIGRQVSRFAFYSLRCFNSHGKIGSWLWLFSNRRGLSLSSKPKPFAVLCREVAHCRVPYRPILPGNSQNAAAGSGSRHVKLCADRR
jgi:hypothetical protein